MLFLIHHAAVSLVLLSPPSADNNHRLNLFYLANDVIQNCKRKNAVVFRSAFGDVLSNAAQFVRCALSFGPGLFQVSEVRAAAYNKMSFTRLFGRDGKVRKSVERIFSIWEERSVYPEEVIAQFKAGLNRKEKERERPKEKEKDKDKEKEKEKEKVAQLGNGMFFLFASQQSC